MHKSLWEVALFPYPAQSSTAWLMSKLPGRWKSLLGLWWLVAVSHNDDVIKKQTWTFCYLHTKHRERWQHSIGKELSSVPCIKKMMLKPMRRPGSRLWLQASTLYGRKWARWSDLTGGLIWGTAISPFESWKVAQVHGADVVAQKPHSAVLNPPNHTHVTSLVTKD